LKYFLKIDKDRRSVRKIGKVQQPHTKLTKIPLWACDATTKIPQGDDRFISAQHARLQKSQLWHLRRKF